MNANDETPDPAMEPVIEAGGGESEGFELAEEALIENASHEADGSTSRIFQHAEGVDEEGEPDPDLYGEADDAEPHDDGPRSVK